MPTSRINHVPVVMNIINQLKPESILDIGVGFGKWGHLFREYTDIVASEDDAKRYPKEHWKVKIDGIEGFASYLTDMHRYIYDDIHVGDMREIIKTLPKYDIVFMGDVIEHITKEDGFEMLKHCREHANKAVIVSTPKHETEQEDLCENDLEIHRSLWTVEDFKSIDRTIVTVVDKSIILAVSVMPGVEPPQCQRQTQFPGMPMPKSKQLWRKFLVKTMGWSRFQKMEQAKRWKGK